MALLSKIIRDAYRESNLIAVSAEPTAAEQTEGLDRLNTILGSLMGQEVGLELADLNIGGAYDQSAHAREYVPENARLVLNLGGNVTLRLHPQPYEGQRIAVVDGLGNLGTFSLTLDGHGRRIGALASLTISAAAGVGQWFYRADTGSWAKLSGLLATDEMPFPGEFDDYFVTRLAMRLNPRHSAKLDDLSLAAFTDAQQRLQARYRRPRLVPDMPTPGLLNESGSAFGTTSGFLRGRGW